MEGHQGILLALILATFTITHQDQQGFISLDCGLPTKESPYFEPKTKLKFSSDAEFIKSGKSGKAADDWLSDHKPNNVLRYFPEGEGPRNCYNLIVNQGMGYLIRAGFSYGNYDGLHTYPKFDLYIGPNLWTAVDVQSEDHYEIIHKPKSNSLQICLVKTGQSTPMISTLEVRPLGNDVYTTQSDSLKLSDRFFYRGDSDTPAVR
ncbi:unnamed protein product [Thlaspi arvense]|uniref:Malectin-like domain-containing protein n=1 Tax=Thlaspi arvense TaxID=13288 RepID=A0AAU9S889_THLAR|nr:unnamed protein product [Thlaspi arvense]